MREDHFRDWCDKNGGRLQMGSRKTTCEFGRDRVSLRPTGKLRVVDEGDSPDQDVVWDVEDPRLSRGVIRGIGDPHHPVEDPGEIIVTAGHGELQVGFV